MSVHTRRCITQHPHNYIQTPYSNIAMKFSLFIIQMLEAQWVKFYCCVGFVFQYQGRHNKVRSGCNYSLFSVYPFPCDDWENIYTLYYYHRQIGSMNYYPLFRNRSWNNGVRCMSFCFLIEQSEGNLVDPIQICDLPYQIHYTVYIYCNVKFCT